MPSTSGDAEASPLEAARPERQRPGVALLTLTAALAIGSALVLQTSTAMRTEPADRPAGPTTERSHEREVLAAVPLDAGAQSPTAGPSPYDAGAPSSPEPGLDRPVAAPYGLRPEGGIPVGGPVPLAAGAQPFLGIIAPTPAPTPQPTLRATPRPTPRAQPTRQRERSEASDSRRDDRRSGGGAWHVTTASWYGPGFYGNRTACGLRYTKTIVGVAHRSLPCGTRLQIRWRGKTVTVPVIDRGPYVKGRDLDLSAALSCRIFGSCITRTGVQWRVAP